MKKVNLALIVTSCLLIGALFFLFQRNWLMLQWPIRTAFFDGASIKKESISKRSVSLYWWKNEKFYHEDEIVIWHDNNGTDSIKHVVDRWLLRMVQEKILLPSMIVDSVALSSDGQSAYLSFNQSFMWTEWSIMKKWMLIESLCKTLKSTDLSVKHLIFLVKQEIMEDIHLDFTYPWPIDGYLEE